MTMIGSAKRYLCMWEDDRGPQARVLVADGIRRALGMMETKKRRPDMAVFALGDDMRTQPWPVRLFYDPIYDRVTLFDGDRLIDAAGVAIRRRVYSDCV